MMRLLYIGLILCLSGNALAHSNHKVYHGVIEINVSESAHDAPHITFNKKWKQKVFNWVASKENKRLTAATITILAGPLGAHRLYLGTATHVPVVYTLTLGGGLGILPACDLIAILCTKDLSRFENNERIIMWLN